MSRLILAALVFLSACAQGPTPFRRAATQDVASDAIYSKALAQLDPSNKQGTLDSAIKYLDAYLASPAQAHRAEAEAMRRLTRDAQQLARLEATLHQARTAENRPRESDSKGRDEEAVKEIQRLKDELAKANEELERIRKRLATPKPSQSPHTK